jgi:hypothetical protein
LILFSMLPTETLAKGAQPPNATIEPTTAGFVLAASALDAEAMIPGTTPDLPAVRAALDTSPTPVQPAEVQVTPVGRWPVYARGLAQAVVVSGNYAYVAAGVGGLIVIDISNPSNPVRVGGLDTLGGAVDVAVAGNYAYVADGGAGLQVIDISNPANPVLVGGIVTPGDAFDVAVAGNYAYVAGGGAGLQVIDVSNPANPVWAGTNLGYASDVAVAGNYAYVAGGGAGLQVIDVSNPANPVWVGGIDTPGYASDVAVAGINAYVAGGEWFSLPIFGSWWVGGLQVINVSNPANPVEAGAFATVWRPSDVAVVGNHAFVAVNEWHDLIWQGWRPSHLLIIDVSNPANPVGVGGFETPRSASGVAVAGNIAYVAGWDAGLQVIDVRNPANPIRVGGYDTSGRVDDVAVTGNYAYVANWNAGLQVIDVLNPANPVRVGGTPGGAIMELVVAGNYAYVAVVADWGRLQVIDVRNPANLVLMGNFGTTWGPLDAAVAGNYAYLASGEAGLQVIDVSNPANPIQVGGFDTPGHASSVAVAGSYAFVACQEWAGGGAVGRLHVINVRNPANPFQMGSIDIDTSMGTSDVAVAGSYAYVTDWDGRLHVIDVSNPVTPIRVGGIDIDAPMSIYGVVVVGNNAYVAGGYTGLHVIDVSKPANPIRVGGFDTPGQVSDVAVAGNHVFIAEGCGGLQILRVEVAEPVRPTVIATSPRADDIAAPVGNIITATFSEAIQPGTLAVQVIAQEGHTPPAVKNVTVSDRILAITLTAPLAHGIGYGVMIEKGAVRNLAGKLNPAFNWAFVTAAVTAPGQPPVLRSPAHQKQAVAVAPVLEWHPVSGADSYIVQIAKDAVFTNFILNRSTKTTSFQISPALGDNTTYFWRVLAAAGPAVGPWSEVRSFTTGARHVFAIGERVQVAHTRGAGLRLREEGNLLARTLTMMPEGTGVTILDGPVFADGFTWWRVRYEALEGWSAGQFLAQAGDNLPPDAPINLRQLDFTATELAVGGISREYVILLQALVLDPDGQQVKLEVELRPVGEGFRQRATHSSEFVPNGHQAEINIARLPDGGYRWRARTVDVNGLASEWVCFGANNEAAVDLSVDAWWPPTALFNHRPALIVSGEVITFDASGSRDRDGDIVSFNWDFGDGRTAVGKEVQHSFAAPGRYTVTLTVTDAQGFRSRRSVEVNVLGRELQDAINQLFEDSEHGLGAILTNAARAGNVTDNFLEEIGQAVPKIVWETAVDFAFFGFSAVKGVNLEKVNELANEDNVELAKGMIQGIIDDIPEDVAKQVIKELGGLGIKLWEAFENDRKPSEIIPLLESQIQHHRNKLTNLRNKALVAAAELSPEQQASHLKALQSRQEGNSHVHVKHSTQVNLPATWAQMMQNDRQNWRHIGAKLLFDVSIGVGAVGATVVGAAKCTLTAPVCISAVALGIKGGALSTERLIDISDTMAQQDKNAQILFLALQSLTDSTLKARAIFENTAAGLKAIIETRTVIPAEGEIIDDIGTVLWGITRTMGTAGSTHPGFFPVENNIRFAIKNTAPANTDPMTYYLYAVHKREVSTVKLKLGGARTYRLPIGIFSEPVILYPGKRKVVSLEFYRNEKGGVIPTGPVTVYLIAKDNTGGIFYLDSKLIFLGTTFIDEEGRIIPEKEAENLRILPYPVRSEVRYRPLTNDFEHTIFLSNPDETTVAVRLEQPLPSGIAVISAGNGIHHQDNISWELILEAGERKYLEVVFRPQGEATKVEMPGAKLTMYDRVNDNWVGFQASQVKREILVDNTVEIASIPGVTAPVTGATPVTTITPTTQYTGTVSWSPVLAPGGTFAPGTVYTATITLAAKPRFTFDGVASNFFTVAGAVYSTNPPNSGIITAIFPETAPADPVVSVTGIKVTPETATINIGATQQLTATVLPENATNKDVTWSSSDQAIATVDATGLVTGVAPGTVTVTATSVADPTISATAAVTVAAVKHTLTMAVYGEGSTYPAVGAHVYAANTVLTITATPAPGWQFSHWVGDVADTNAPTTTVTMDTSKTVTAHFTAVPVTPPVPAVAGISLSQAVDENGIVVIPVKVTRVKDPATGTTVNMPGGLRAYKAKITTSPEGGIQVLAVRGTEYFPDVTFDPATGTFAASQALVPGQPNNTAVAKLVLRLTGSTEVSHTLTVTFQEIVAAETGQKVPAVKPISLTFRRGDANADGMVNIIDAMFIAQKVVGARGLDTVNALNAASVRHDGASGDRVNIVDAMFIAQHVVGIRDKYFE